VRDLARERYAIVPQMADYDRLKNIAVPYLMSLHEPRFRSSTVNTDEHGLRLNGPPESFGEEGMSVLIGGSAAFGVGATSDASTVSGYLGAKTGTRWVNLGGRAHNSTQEIILFLMHASRIGRVRRIVLMTGINNLVLFYLARQFSEVYGAFFDMEAFFKRSESKDEPVGILQKMKSFLTGSAISELPPNNLHMNLIKNHEEQRGEVLSVLDCDLGIWRSLADGLGASLSFFLQPTPLWAGKPLASEETRLFEILDAMQNGVLNSLFSSLSQSNYEWYREALSETCEKHAIPFFDMNADFRVAKDTDWLFVDRIHLTDKGNLRAASMIAEHCK